MAEKKLRIDVSTADDNNPIPASLTQDELADDCELPGGRRGHERAPQACSRLFPADAARRRIAAALRCRRGFRKFSRAAPRDRPRRRAYMAALSACRFNPPAQRLPTTASRRWQ